MAAPQVDFTPVITRTGGEILVNTTTVGNQRPGGITYLADGGFVVVFADFSRTGGDTVGWAVRAQVYAADGTPVGGEFLVNTTTADNQLGPLVTPLQTGGFVIAWSDYSRTGGDTSDQAIRAQVFNAVGGLVGAEFLVNSTTSGDQTWQVITSLSGGGFVITWKDGSHSGGDTSGDAVRAQVFNADGSRLGSEFLVNTTTALSQEAPKITALSNGGFAIIWEDDSQTGGDTSGNAVRAQLFDATGAPLGTEFLVNSTTAGNQTELQIEALPGGGFVVVWTDDGETGGDTDGAAIRAQVFTDAGAAAGPEILVNTNTVGEQELPKVTVLLDGGFVVAWLDEQMAKAQVFTAAGVPVGTEIVVYGATTDDQYEQQIVALANGGFVIVFTDESPNADGSSSAVRAQVFDAAGVMIGTSIIVPATTTGGQRWQVTTALPNGGFVVSWTDFSLTGGDTTGEAARAQVINVGPHADEQVPLDLKNAGFTVSDADDDILTVTLSTTYGKLTVTAGGSGAEVSGSGTASVTITGTAAQIAALLNGDATSVVSYLAHTDTPPTSATVTLLVDDGNGGTDQVSVIIPIQGVAELVLTPGADDATGTPGDDTLDGLAGDDTIDGGAGDDTLEGGDGDDYLKGGDGDDYLVGGTGNDTYVVDSLGDTTDETGGDGIDLVHSRVSWTLGVGFENLTLGSAGGSINGTGNSLDNVITGNAGANTLSGLAGADTLIGAGGNDILQGGLGEDSLDGGNGNDRLDGGDGADAMTGGAGNDTYVVDNAGDTVVELPGGGTDTIETTLSSLNLADYANVENVTVIGGSASVIGSNQANVLTGGAGSDEILGRAGDDRLFGDAGNDVLRGGAGADTLTGGLGADRFSFDAGDIIGDRIADLSFAEGDIVDLSGVANGDMTFVTRFTKTAGEAMLTYNAVQNLTWLRIDLDGDGRFDTQLSITGDVSGTTRNLYTGGGDTDGGWLL